jgi:hypothetical protein
MGINPIMGVAAIAVSLLCIGLVLHRIRTGRFRYGTSVYTRSETPVEYWFGLLFPAGVLMLLSLSLATDMGSNDFRFDQSVFWSIWATFMGFLLTRALQTGFAGGQQISFARSDEPREFWIIVLLYAIAEAVAVWMLFKVLSLPPR